ncbi:MAG: nicotinate phosphoribosyltransferase [Oligoflexales bacterium]|nr:nicotinate phosphoribosyltransferase [Oligoflexales bacterium]
MFARNQDFNICLATDSYKVSHAWQYPPGTETVYSYFESRGGMEPKILWFGLQYYLKKYLTGPIVDPKKIEEAEAIYAQHFGKALFNKEGWTYIWEKHKGHLPIKIKSAPEGTLIDTQNVLMTVENTDPRCYWLTSWLETLLSKVWYPATVATRSYSIKALVQKFLEKTGGIEGLDFKLHDFGYRGVSSEESAGIGGAAHLINFKGTDTVAALVLIRQYYGLDEGIAGFSIPASEHSTMTAWGREGEEKAFLNMLEKFPEGHVAVVSDSYDIYKACSEIWGERLKEKVLNRKGTLVIRPDSGKPEEVTLSVLRILGEKFGTNINSKGYRELDPHVRIILGDGVNRDSIARILEIMEKETWSASNLTFGAGAALLQKLDRDTHKFAFKCSALKQDENWRDVFKAPITDPGKSSKPGRLILNRQEDGTYITKKISPHSEAAQKAQDLLETVFLNGVLIKDTSFTEIRNRAQ